MNHDEEAELRRKLSMTSVPKPPDGLLERIHADIPEHLEVVRRRRSFTTELGIAASIIVLIGAAWIAMHVTSRRNMEIAPPPSTAASVRARSGAPAAPPLTSPKPVTQIAEARNQPPPEEPKSAPEAARKKEAAPLPQGVSGGVSGSVAGGVSGGVVGGVSGGMIGGAPSAPAVIPPSPSPPPSEAPPVAKTQANDILARSAVAEEVTLTPSSLFGIATTSRRLDAKNTASVVEHFAAPEARPKHALRVEADAAPQPLDPTHDVVRVSIDAPAGENAPVASDAKLEIEFDPHAVVSHRALVGESSATERVIVTNASATLLFDIELAPNLSRRQEIATVRLTWRSVTNGKEQKVERVIRRRDVASTWESASERTKRTSLAAAWAEAVRSGAPADEIARRAREAGFDELADLAGKP